MYKDNVSTNLMLQYYKSSILYPCNIAQSSFVERYSTEIKFIPPY